MNPWEIKAESVERLFIEQHRAELKFRLVKIEHCLNQLTDEDIWWRPYEEHNAIGNIILHCCGNMRQWLIDGLNQTPDVRDRPGEFASRDRIAKEELLNRLRDTINEADAAIASIGPDELLSPRRIQGFDVTAQSAILDSVAHLGGHTQEIIWITRLRLGVDYQFYWVPQSPEQGAP